MIDQRPQVLRPPIIIQALINPISIKSMFIVICLLDLRQQVNLISKAGSHLSELRQSKIAVVIACFDTSFQVHSDDRLLVEHLLLAG